MAFRAPTSDIFRAVLAGSTLLGATIGVGIFAVPYAMSSIGLVPALLLFAALAGVQLLQHLFYAEAAMATKEKLRLPGLVRKYLGDHASRLATAAAVLSYWGAMLAYIIVGGSFLRQLLGGASAFPYQLGWGIVTALIVGFGLQKVARIGFVATAGMLAALLAVAVAGLARAGDFSFPAPAQPDWLLPYGIILFSLGGLPAIPEMEDLMNGRHRHFRAAIAAAVAIAAVLTAAFGVIVWGASGAGVTPDGVTGFAAAFGPRAGALLAVFGFLAVTTPYLTMATNLAETFRYDHGLRPLAAWAAATLMPLAAFLLGAHDFVRVIGFSGAVFGGITAILVTCMYLAIKKRRLMGKRALAVPSAWAYAALFVLACGAAVEVAKVLGVIRQAGG